MQRQPYENKIGRIKNEEFQIFFMNKLKCGKLQSISAQSQAQILCSQYKNRNQKSKNDHLDHPYNQQKIAYVKNLFENFNSKKFTLLWQLMKQAAEKWSFKQFHGIHDFPQFLFCDECDLCYVLHSYLTSQIIELKQKTQISNDELLYFQLLCYSTRDRISFRIIKAIQAKLQGFLNKMKDVKNNVITSYRYLYRQQPVIPMPKAPQAEDIIPKQLREGQIKHVLHKVQTDLKELQKTKQISKDTKNDKKRGRPKKIIEQDQNQLLSQQQFEKISQKLITHIIQAYAYIYPTQLKKKKLARKEIAIQADSQLPILNMNSI